MKKENGITLIALIITVIILVILAGITISQLSNSGIFEKTKEAKSRWHNAQEFEETQIAKYNNEINDVISNRNSKMNYINLTDYISSSNWTKAVNLDELKKYDLFILSGYWDGEYKNKACSTIFTLEELLNCGDNCTGQTGFSNYICIDISYHNDDQYLYIKTKGIGRLMAIY